MPNLLPATTITTAVSATAEPWVDFPEYGSPRHLAVQANFVYGSGGTNATAYIQTSFDGGATAIDVACFQFSTSSARKGCNLSEMTPVTTIASLTDGSLTANNCVDGLLGPIVRVKLVTTGTYAASTTLQVDCVF